MDSRYTISFIDLFDWEKESDRHYMNLMQGPLFEEEFILPKDNKKNYKRREAKIVLKHKKKDNGNNNTEVNKGALSRNSKKGLQP